MPLPPDFTGEPSMISASNGPYALPPAFQFQIMIGGKTDSDTSFTEVTGIGAEMLTESYTELNENRFAYRLPKTLKSSTLVAKRGIAPNTSPLVQWCKKVLVEYRIPIEVQIISVSLFNAKGQPSRRWDFHDAYPIKWHVDGFSAKKNEIAIETLSSPTPSARIFLIMSIEIRQLLIKSTIDETEQGQGQTVLYPIWSKIGRC